MKFLKVIIITLLVIIGIVLVAVLVFGSLAKQRTDSYYKYSNPVGVIEQTYAPMGPSEVSEKVFPSDNKNIGQFIIRYPSELEKNDTHAPVVLWANGTGSKSGTYQSFLNHLSSWGFITLVTDDENSRTGESLNAAIDLLIKENGNPDSVLYQKVNLEKIGIGGHSQGGVAVFNMATIQPHADLIKTVYAVSATSSYHSNIFQDGWQYDISKVKVPTFLTAGTGAFDAGTATSADQKSDEKAGIMQGITPLWSLEENFNLLTNVDKVYVRKTNIDHGDSYLQFDAYMTAWFRYYLMDDKEAGKAFYGENPELSQNENYQDFKSHLHE
ncbi:TPA: alpha/beta hydrolase family protein [Streptococcus suis]